MLSFVQTMEEWINFWEYPHIDFMIFIFNFSIHKMYA